LSSEKAQQSIKQTCESQSNSTLFRASNVSECNWFSMSHAALSVWRIDLVHD
jgi:hypothetical protein